MNHKDIHDIKEAHLKIKILLSFLDSEEHSEEYLSLIKEESVKITQILSHQKPV